MAVLRVFHEVLGARNNERLLMKGRMSDIIVIKKINYY